MRSFPASEYLPPRSNLGAPGFPHAKAYAAVQLPASNRVAFHAQQFCRFPLAVSPIRVAGWLNLHHSG